MKPNIQKAELKITAGDPRQFPRDPIPQIAFSGRSNVGKSSLVNSLLGRKSLARVSSSPGKTITVNFYDVDRKLYLVDLPGYGYAKRGQKGQEQIKRIIESYILQREQMTCLFVLIDSRLAPQAIDLEFTEWLGENGVPFAIIFTKIDKISKGRLNENVNRYKERLLETWEELPPIFYTSSEKKEGKEELLDYIEQVNKGLASETDPEA